MRPDTEWSDRKIAVLGLVLLSAVVIAIAAHNILGGALLIGGYLWGYGHAYLD